ncbi:hydroxyethylthiazole kinase-like uncharacterized protein yjeF/hydroxyethylthiazole kinase-like uncharacterized protein yjeF [Rhodovulum imhoffii]|uniref:Bifunctional NAD(P)H-hydrate repair enzyme n=1 Tax=Rhodovulum imhoffii TaxID=365340 RepID=A0A2T5BL74_9RHOB|nr:NAD(P)H-hydrate dehydratase [Rhodovulum imhoffii]MBK5932500.1 bifunctional ADP-dependent NAD(P)H-hydrate dehydratase/NAD(P)H-hydrate epimerase [Rhodovulum imhoffii]PTM99700.1 hydroxyethylthiazole kinase-like uncharacterized protein yjeF/hydroxyethylthiazole kinase-like uncharacterized protein yjeF [Rhodovulum imhoffii]
MTEILTSAQMRAIESAAIESGQVSGAELMERAGKGVIEALFARWPDLAAGSHRAVVLCGPGNNGGDGFVIARLLKHWGWDVRVHLFGAAERLPPDARLNHDRWAALGPVAPLPSVPDMRGAVVIDALFGTGLTRPLPAALLSVADGAARVVAVDIPSGLCADSGRAIGGTALRADLTVSFHRLKLGHVLADGPVHCGEVVVCPIGLRGGVGVGLAQPDTVLLSKRGGHKYAHGHALVLSGGAGCTGAARLAARAALRVGAGLVTLGVPAEAGPEVAAQITAVMLRRVEGGADLAAVLEDARYSALCLGPGLGLGARARGLVRSALNGVRPVVLDADALSLFASGPETLFNLIHGAEVVLTPHDGEFARLFPDLAAPLHAPAGTGPAASRLVAARQAARRAGAVVLLKGPDTIIAAPDGTAVVSAASYERAAPWLATAGAGDVLAGLICGLLARGAPPFAASRTAAWLHVEAARVFGPGLIAEDLPEILPRVLRRLQV